MGALTTGEEATLRLLQEGTPMLLALRIGAVVDAWHRYEHGEEPATPAPAALAQGVA